MKKTWKTPWAYLTNTLLLAGLLLLGTALFTGGVFNRTTRTLILLCGVYSMLGYFETTPSDCRQSTHRECESSLTCCICRIFTREALFPPYVFIISRIRLIKLSLKSPAAIDGEERAPTCGKPHAFRFCVSLRQAILCAFPVGNSISCPENQIHRFFRGRELMEKRRF